MKSKRQYGRKGKGLLLGEDKYGPGEGAMWKRVNARFPNLYKALLEEPDKATRGAWLKRAVSEAG